MRLTAPSDIRAKHERQSALRPSLAPPSPNEMPPTRVLQSPAWEVFPPPGAFDFYAAASQSVTGPNTTVTPVALRVQLQAGYVAVVRDVSLTIADILTTANVLWTLRFNQNNVQGWTNLTVLPRAAAFVSKSFEAASTMVRVPDGNLIDWSIIVVDGGTYVVGVEFHGWMVSKAVAKRYGFRE